MSEEYINKRANGYETAFNMVNSMLGTMYISGRTEKCDEFDFWLVCEGVSMHKKSGI